MGATDVCPFVPVSGVTMADCVEIARRLGQRVGDELGIPVYLYEEAASAPERRSLAYLREGEYEGLGEKLKKKAYKPDFGRAAFNARSGATVIGAREFLIAYNVNLNTRNVKLAKEIANRMREKGYTVKNPRPGKRRTSPARSRPCAPSAGTSPSTRWRRSRSTCSTTPSRRSTASSRRPNASPPSSACA